MKPSCKFCKSKSVNLSKDRVMESWTWIHCKKCGNFTIDRGVAEEIKSETNIKKTETLFSEGDKVKLIGIDQEILKSPCVGHPINGSKGKVDGRMAPEGKVTITFPARTKLIKGSKYTNSFTIFVKSDLVTKI